MGGGAEVWRVASASLPEGLIRRTKIAPITNGTGKLGQVAHRSQRCADGPNREGNQDRAATS
jgi:hypothetical protein